MKHPQRKLLSAAIALALAAGSANAVLERVGPPNNAPSVGGFPAWYQDTSGLALDFCDPKNAAEVAGGWCLLLPGDIPTPPEAFPTEFFDEHFYWAASASPVQASQSRIILVLAQEAAFATGAPAPGAQITFARIRVVMTPVPVTGTYRFIHPYGEELIDAVAGGKIFFTDDVGVNCPPGQFDCALNGRGGPFLLPSATPGGAEMPAVSAANPAPDTNPAHFGGAFAATPYPGTGKAYIADPARSGPVTGSPLPDFVDSTGQLRNHNIFRIEGPVGSGIGVDPATGAAVDWLETTDFSLMGRVMDGAMPGQVDVERATYARSAAGNQLDVVAKAVEAAQGRLPAQPRPAKVAPQLTFFAAPCAGVVDAAGNVQPPYSAPVGVTETQMFAGSGSYWGQVQPLAIPASVCVKDASARDLVGNLAPAFVPQPVTDQVTITQALYDPSAATLTVAARSSDATLPPTLSLAYQGFRGDLAGGQIVVPGVIVPPADVSVLSSAQGASKYQVKTGFAAAAPGPAALPVALNDTATFLEDSGAQLLAPLANDSNAVGGTLNITSLPRLGSAVVNLDGTVSYTPNLNANGTDAFTYTVTAGTAVSNTGTVTLNITPVNDPPVAVNNSAATIINVPVSINLLVNDTDPDGFADIVAAVNVSPSTPLGATISVAGGIASFNAPAAGAYTFTYQAQDAAGVLSANAATVSVQVAGAQTITFAKAEYVRSGGGLRVQGTLSPAASQNVRVEFVNAAGTVLGLAGTATSDAAGNWAINQKGVVLPVGATAVKATSAFGTVQTRTLAIK